MFERLRQTLVESFVGAIALGYVLAQGILNFVGIFTSPVAGWVSRNDYRALTEHATASVGLPLQDALPDLIRAVLLLLVWYALVRWLYFRPLKINTSESASASEQAAGD